MVLRIACSVVLCSLAHSSHSSIAISFFLRSHKKCARKIVCTLQTGVTSNNGPPDEICLSSFGKPEQHLERGNTMYEFIELQNGWRIYFGPIPSEDLKEIEKERMSLNQVPPAREVSVVEFQQCEMTHVPHAQSVC